MDGAFITEELDWAVTATENAVKKRAMLQRILRMFITLNFRFKQDCRAKKKEVKCRTSSLLQNDAKVSTYLRTERYISDKNTLKFDQLTV